MGKKSIPKPPDYTELIKASQGIADENAQLAREQMVWAREQDDRNQKVLQQVLGVQLPIMEEQFKNAQKDRERYERTFQPIEDKLIKEFQDYGSPERLAKEQGRAIADVSAAFDQQRKGALSRLESYGVDPSTTRNQALDIGVRTAQAAAQAAAADAATQRVENTGRALRADAINIGRGMPSQAAQSYGQSIAAGQAGIGGASQTTSTGAGALTSGLGFTNAALGGYGQAGSLMNTSYGNKMDAARLGTEQFGQMLDFAGGIAGSAMAMEEGGVVPEAGALPISPIPGSTDRKVGLLTPGEHVIDKSTAEWFGQKHFYDLKKKAQEQRRAIELENSGAVPMNA